MAWLGSLDAGAQVPFLRLLAVPGCGDEATVEVLADIARHMSKLPPDGRTQVTELLLHCAWLADHHADATPLNRLLPDIRDEIASDRMLSIRLMQLDFRGTAERLLGHALRQTLRSRDSTPQQQLTAYSRTLASMLIDGVGRFDTAALFVLRSLVEKEGPLRIVPSIRTHEYLVRLEQFLAADSGLPALIDELSAIEPVHEGPARLIRIECGSPDPDRRQRALSVVASLLCFPRQEDGMGICWLIAPNIQMHLNRPERLLQNMVHWFEHGEIPNKGASGVEYALVPTLHPAHALKEMDRPMVDAPDFLRSPAVVRLVGAVMHACGAGFPEVQEAVMSARDELAQALKPLTLRALLERVLLQRTGLSQRMLERPARTLSPGKLEDIRRYERRLEDCIADLEASHTSLLMFAWAGTIGGDVLRQKLMISWARIESSLGLESETRSTARERAEHLGAVRNLFLTCATFRYKCSGASNNTTGTELELCLRLPQAAGGGTRVRSLQDLQQWLTCLSAEVCKQVGNPDAEIHRWWVGVLGGSRFQRSSSHVLSDILVAWSGAFGRADLESAEFAMKPLITLNPRVTSLVSFPLQIELASVTVQWGVLPLADFRLSDEASLKQLVRMLREMHRLQPDALQETLRSNHGRLHLLYAGVRGLSSLHNMNLLPEHPLLLKAWTDDAGMSTGTWIRTTLVEPVRAKLRDSVTDGAALALLVDVLKACHLRDSVSPQALADELLASVRRAGGKDGGGIRLRDLVTVLQQAGERRTGKCFESRDPLKNGLSLALIGHTSVAGPRLVYADPNWQNADRLFFCFDPIRKKIGHFVGLEVAQPNGQRTVVPTMVMSCFFF